MNIFKATPVTAAASTDSRDCEVTYLMTAFGLTRAEAVRTAAVTESWEYLLDAGHGVSVADEAAMLDAYDAACAHENWSDRVMADAGESAAGMIVAIGGCIGFVIFAAAFGAFVGVS